jgi:hypothetical protein
MMITQTAADPGMSYAEWLQREIAGRLAGTAVCGPPIDDFPTFAERVWPSLRPEHIAERRLERQIEDLDEQLEL